MNPADNDIEIVDVRELADLRGSLRFLDETPAPPPLPAGLENVIDIRSFVNEPGGDLMDGESLEESEIRDISARRRHQQVYKIAYRLLGETENANLVVDRVARRLHSDDSDESLREAVQITLEQTRLQIRRPDHLFDHDDVHAAQRVRVMRELDRHTTEDRVVLALRHLLGLAPARVAMITGRPENDIRAVTSHWVPSDSNHTVTILNTLDTWIDSSLRERQLEAVVPTLDHLDDPNAATLIPQLQS